MYARHLKSGLIGDVNYYGDGVVSGVLHETQRPFSWRVGKKRIELIEFGSFNPKNKNYKRGGRVLEVV